jgi:Fic family protein
MITVLLCHAGVLREPLLYLSLYFKQHRAEYSRLLDQVRTHGDCEAWLTFFLEGVQQTAEGAVTTARRLMDLFEEDRERGGSSRRSDRSRLEPRLGNNR